MYDAKIPVSPFLNSNFNSSVIADLIQKRFVYSLPVEHIIRYYKEMGFDLPKSTAHGSLTKAAELLDKLTPCIKRSYIIRFIYSF